MDKDSVLVVDSYLIYRLSIGLKPYGLYDEDDMETKPEPVIKKSVFLGEFGYKNFFKHNNRLRLL